MVENSFLNYLDTDICTSKTNLDSSEDEFDENVKMFNEKMKKIFLIIFSVH